MSTSAEYFKRAENCTQLAEGATNIPAKKRYQRMEAAWRALAQQEQWLEGEVVSQERGGGGNLLGLSVSPPSS